jgi:hypothetical protein
MNDTCFTQHTQIWGQINGHAKEGEGRALWPHRRRRCTGGASRAHREFFFLTPSRRGAELSVCGHQATMYLGEQAANALLTEQQ